MNIIEIVSKRNVNLTNLNKFNVIEEKQTRKINSKYVNIVYLNDEIWSNEAKMKIPQFYVAFSTVMQLQKSDNIKFHREQLSNEFNHWRAILRHFHVENFLKAAKIEWNALNEKATWKVVDKSINVVILLFKWIFIYKFDSNDYLTKYKTRLIVREDLQDMIDQNVYAIILTFKVFRMFMTLIIVFNLKTRHLDLVNAFLNVTNDADIYCHLSNDYKIREKMLRIIKTLYEQRRFSLFWLKDLTKTCLFMSLKSILEELCLFINEDEIFFFFYVNDIIFVYKKEKAKEINSFIKRLMNKYELKILRLMTFFLEIWIIHDEKHNTINLMQNDYMNKLTKIYQINISIKSFIISLSMSEFITHENEKKRV